MDLDMSHCDGRMEKKSLGSQQDHIPFDRDDCLYSRIRAAHSTALLNCSLLIETHLPF